MYRTIYMILQYDIIHMVHALYRTIHEYLRCVDTIQNVLYTIRYVLYNTDNYDCRKRKKLAEIVQ